jgi:hypothetical protein
MTREISSKSTSVIPAFLSKDQIQVEERTLEQDIIVIIQAAKLKLVTGVVETGKLADLFLTT